jgi:hypothetical protein
MREWRKLHEEFNDLYNSPTITGVVISRRMRWVIRVARMRKKRKAYNFFV